MSIDLLILVVAVLVCGLIHHFLVIPLQWFSFLATPLDGVHRAGGNLFGRHKTWRGVLVMIIGVPLFYSFFSYIYFGSWVDDAVLTGGAVGAGYALAELPNSFAKRRLHIGEGKRGSGMIGFIFYILDQSDSVIGALVAVSLMRDYPLFDYVLIFVAGFFLHAIVDLVLHRVGYKKKRLLDQSNQE